MNSSAVLTQALEQAVLAFNRSDLERAKRLCVQVLNAQPLNFDALSMLGVIAARANFPEAAEDFLRRAVGARPADATAHSNYGIALKNLNRLDEALGSFERALAIDPKCAEAWYNQGNALERLGRLEAALGSYERAININPAYADAHNNRGRIAQTLKNTTLALACYERAIDCRPAYPEAHYNRGVALHELGRLDEACASFDRALRLKPGFVDAHVARGNSLEALGRLDEALQSYQRALAARPDDAVAHNNLGALLLKLERSDEALRNFDRALQLQPGYAGAHNNRGNALRSQRRYAEALQSYQRALAIQPESALTLNNCGVVLQELERLEESLACLEAALRLQPGYAEALMNRGNVLVDLKKFPAAADSYERAIEVRPDYAEAFNNRANTLMELLRFEDALASYERALELKPDYADAWYGRGKLLKELKRVDDALQSFARALSIKPDYDWLFGSWVDTKMQLCDWSDFDQMVAELTARVERRQNATPPFSVLGLVDSPALQRLAAEIWAAREHASIVGRPAIETRGERGRIRVGYFSRDFRNHPVSMLIAETLEMHNRDDFEIIAFSYGPDTRDEMRQRIERSVDRFLDVRDMRDAEVARLARQMGLDIAVDLTGFTGGRTGIFAMRCAPAQVSYLGYLGTLGGDFMDYLIADETIVPSSHKRHYAERIVYLPSYQANDSRLTISNRHFSREELGLARAGFVFCCFNANYKITPHTFDRWMRILRRVNDSQLLLLAECTDVERNLRLEAVKRGVSAERLVFGGKLSVPDYLARFRSADLFLDTLPYNAGTTASNALWAGLPVLTRIGESFPARVAASVLTALGLPELIAETDEQYEATAVELAGSPARLSAIRSKLRTQLLTMPLFDTREFTRHLEDAYRQMHDRWQAGLAPDDIHVRPSLAAVT